MLRHFVLCLSLTLVSFTASAQSDAEIRLKLMRDSQRTYAGACPCPDTRDARGRRCGGRSAYLKPGGASPLCYSSDVSKDMVEAYKNRFKASAAARVDH